MTPIYRVNTEITDIIIDSYVIQLFFKHKFNFHTHIISVLFVINIQQAFRVINAIEYYRYFRWCTRIIFGIFGKFILKYRPKKKKKTKEIPSAFRYTVRTYTVRQNDFRPQKWFIRFIILYLCIYYGC